MLRILLFTLLLHISVFANESDITLVKGIEKEAIVLGEGGQLVYVFVDPLCPYSRKFITAVTQNKKMLSKYRYAIFLYEIKRLHSTQTIYAVYNAKKPLKTLLQIMLNDKKTEYLGDKKVQSRVAKIADVAQQLHIHKRPFLVINE